MTDQEPTLFELELSEKEPENEWQGSPNPCVRKLGPGPIGMTCKRCKLLVCTWNNPNRRYYKCELRKPHTHGPGTDHRVTWPACARFEEK